MTPDENTKPLLYVGGEWFEVVAFRPPRAGEKWLNLRGCIITEPPDTIRGPGGVTRYFPILNPIPTPKQFLPVDELVGAAGRVVANLKYDQRIGAEEERLLAELATDLKPFTEKEERFYYDPEQPEVLRDREDKGWMWRVHPNEVCRDDLAAKLNELATSTKEGS